MKKWSLLICACLISSVVFAAPTTSIRMDNISVVRLGKIKTNSITLELSHPGTETNLCNIVMKSAVAMSGIRKDLLSRFQFTRWYSSEKMNYDVNAKGSLVFKIGKAGVRGNYVDGLTITTVDGKSIASNIAAIYGMPDGFLVNDIGMFAGMC